MILCGAIIVFFGDRESILVRLVDPIFSLVSIALLLGLSYPYSKFSLDKFCICAHLWLT